MLKYFYTTVEHEKQLAYFGQLTQGDMSVEEFAMKINKIAKIAITVQMNKKDHLFED